MEATLVAVASLLHEQLHHFPTLEICGLMGTTHERLCGLGRGVSGQLRVVIPN